MHSVSSTSIVTSIARSTMTSKEPRLLQLQEFSPPKESLKGKCPTTSSSFWVPVRSVFYNRSFFFFIENVFIELGLEVKNYYFLVEETGKILFNFFPNTEFLLVFIEILHTPGKTKNWV